MAHWLVIEGVTLSFTAICQWAWRARLLHQHVTAARARQGVLGFGAGWIVILGAVVAVQVSAPLALAVHASIAVFSAIDQTPSRRRQCSARRSNRNCVVRRLEDAAACRTSASNGRPVDSALRRNSRRLSSSSRDPVPRSRMDWASSALRSVSVGVARRGLAPGERRNSRPARAPIGNPKTRAESFLDAGRTR